MELKDKIECLIDNYKIVSEESKSYLSEMMRCFIYSAVAIGIGLGYGESKQIDRIIKYMPFAFLAVIIYFLTLGFMYVNTCRYKAQLESKINQIAGDELFSFESKYKPEIFKYGFLPVLIKGKRYQLLPLPNLLLGFLALLALPFLAWKSSLIQSQLSLFVVISTILGFFGIYVFLISPIIIAKFQKSKRWVE